MHGKSGKAMGYLITLVALAAAGICGGVFYFSSSSIHSLLTENHALNKAVTNLTKEEQIGYATLHSRSRNAGGAIESIIRFVQTDPENPKQIVSEQLFTVTGEIVHFDALIIKFTDAFVKEGKERALYIWRRIYGEETEPGKGTLIETPGTAPERYYSITKSLQMKNRAVFWEAIWELANDPAYLSKYGVWAIFGNAVYARIEPGKIYIFKISPTGQIYPEVTEF
jgi:hypothetical protein